MQSKAWWFVHGIYHGMYFEHYKAETRFVPCIVQGKILNMQGLVPGKVGAVVGTMPGKFRNMPGKVQGKVGVVPGMVPGKFRNMLGKVPGKVGGSRARCLANFGKCWARCHVLSLTYWKSMP